MSSEKRFEFTKENIDLYLKEVAKATSVMKDAINLVGDRYGLPNGWLDVDFTNTYSYSYSLKLSQFSMYHKTYANIVTIRTVAAEYLFTIKIRSARQYKSNLSDSGCSRCAREARDADLYNC